MVTHTHHLGFQWRVHPLGIYSNFCCHSGCVNMWLTYDTYKQGGPTSRLLKASTFLGFGVDVGTHLWVRPKGGLNFNGALKTCSLLLKFILLKHMEWGFIWHILGIFLLSRYSLACSTFVRIEHCMLILQVCGSNLDMGTLWALHLSTWLWMKMKTFEHKIQGLDSYRSLGQVNVLIFALPRLEAKLWIQVWAQDWAHICG